MGDKIVSKKERKEALPPALAQKIARYKARWRTKEGDRWMLSARFAKTDSKQPTLVERCKDQCAVDRFTRVGHRPRICFSILPLWAWQTL